MLLYASCVPPHVNNSQSGAAAKVRHIVFTAMILVNVRTSEVAPNSCIASDTLGAWTLTKLTKSWYRDFLCACSFDDVQGSLSNLNHV